MQVARWGSSFAVRLPVAVVEALDLREGDEIDIDVARDRGRERALERVRALRRPLPPGWRFDRDEANGRRSLRAFSTRTSWSTPSPTTIELSGPKRRSVRAASRGVQALNEFANVARRKLGFGWDEGGDALRAIRTLCRTIVPLDLGVHDGTPVRSTRRHRGRRRCRVSSSPHTKGRALSDEPSMTVAKLIQHLSRFPQDAEVVDLDVSVVVDADANLVQSLSLWENDGPEDDDPEDPEREDLPADRDRKVVNLSPRRSRT